MKTLLSAGLACIFGVVVACSDSSSPTEADPKPSSGSSKQIDSEGGTVSDGDASVEVPANALDSATKITVAESSVKVDAPDGYVLAGPAIAFTPHGLSFLESVTLTLPYSSNAGQLAVLRLDDEADKSWEVIDGGTFSSGSATLAVNSFSIYAVAAEAASTGSGGGGNAGGAPDTGAGGAPDVAGGAPSSAGAPNSAGAGNGGGDLSFSCDHTSLDNGLRICTDHFYPALIVQLAGDQLMKVCPETSVMSPPCETTGPIGGCRTVNADGLPGVIITNWFYEGTVPDLMNGIFCKRPDTTFVAPP